MDESANRLFRIRHTVMQMLKDRGYLVADLEINMTKFDFLNKFGEGVKRDDLFISKSKRNDPGEQVSTYSSNLSLFWILIGVWSFISS